ncbi:hypothetical protein JCM19233_1981 [Vibrio astriarenae]|nr:hypothetical protein JCM19233_1981 [Vibrio sp. C7]
MFKGCHFPSELILEAVCYYLAYKLSYREIEEIPLSYQIYANIGA